MAGLIWLAPMLVGHQLRWIPGDVAKVRFLTHFLGGMPRTELAERARAFVDVLAGHVRSGAADRLRWHEEQGHEVVIVSASLDLWLAPFAEQRGLRLISSTAAFDDEDRFTGGLVGPNVNHDEKVRAVREALDLDAYDTIYAYGDSSGDEAMLGLADDASFKPFRGS